MVSDFNPRLFLIIGFTLLLVGFLLPLLMVMQVLKSTFFLNFLAYGASFVGLMMGFIGTISIVARNRKK